MLQIYISVLRRFNWTYSICSMLSERLQFMLMSTGWPTGINSDWCWSGMSSGLQESGKSLLWCLRWFMKVSECFKVLKQVRCWCFYSKNTQQVNWWNWWINARWIKHFFWSHFFKNWAIKFCHNYKTYYCYNSSLRTRLNMEAILSVQPVLMGSFGV